MLEAEIILEEGTPFLAGGGAVPDPPPAAGAILGMTGVLPVDPTPPLAPTPTYVRRDHA